MVKTFFDNLGQVAPDVEGDGAGRAVTDTVIMASIVEREYRVDEEAPLIASVFYNRLQQEHRA